MSRLVRLNAYLFSSVAALSWGYGAQAADLLLSPEPIAQQDVPLAVSAVNGKLELDLGSLNATGAFRAAGSLSIPVGDRFGIQGDLMVTTSGATGTVFAGAIHAFTRDPSSYLLGVTAAAVVAPGATLAGVGVEGELYLDRVSLEGWAGLAGVHYNSPPPGDATGLFAFGDIAYYPTDDWRLVAGGSYVLGQSALHVGTEYLLRDQVSMPLSISADARISGSGNYVATIGLKGYFGGNDDNKSLIDRHRQDDPRNRAVDFYNGATDILVDHENFTDPEASQGACESMGGEWVYDSFCDMTNAPQDACEWVIDNVSEYQYYEWNGSECLYNNS